MPDEAQIIPLPESIPALVTVRKLGKDIGVSRSVVYHWRDRGWLKASVNISGVPYCTAADIREFLTRALTGEFAKSRNEHLAAVRLKKVPANERYQGAKR